MTDGVMATVLSALPPLCFRSCALVDCNSSKSSLHTMTQCPRIQETEVVEQQQFSE